MPTPRQSKPEAILDRDHLASLEAHLGRAETRELLADGMLELEDRLERLAEEADGAAFAALAHDIAGLAGQLGMALLARDAGLASRAAGAGRDPGPAIAEIDRVREDSFDALRTWCARRGGAGR